MRLSLLAALLLAPALANAQFVPRSPPPPERMPGIADMGSRTAEPSPRRELIKLRDGIDSGRRDGSLTKGEARALRREARQVDTLIQRYGADGLSDSERREIDMRVRALQSLTAAQRTMRP